MATLRKGDIVVGVDDTPLSMAALTWAMEEASVTGRTVVALRAWSFDPEFDLEAALAGSPESFEAMQRKALSDALAEARRGLEYVPVREELVKASPASALIEAAETASMIVLGSHGYGHLLRLLVGSVTERCLRQASCPVVIIPARTVPDKQPVHRNEITGAHQPGPLL